jgi:hypothetical protein
MSENLFTPDFSGFLRFLGGVFGFLSFLTGRGTVFSLGDPGGGSWWGRGALFRSQTFMVVHLAMFDDVIIILEAKEKPSCYLLEGYCVVILLEGHWHLERELIQL